MHLNGKPVLAVREFGDGYQASVPVPASWRNERGVVGQSTDEGPWIGAEDKTPEGAVKALLFKIGAIALDQLLREGARGP